MRPRTCLATAALTLVLFAPAAAVLLVPLSDAQLTAASTHVVLVTFTGVSVSTQDPDGNGTSQPWTTLTARVDQSLKGPLAAGDTLTFLQMGGTAGGRTVRIPGMPAFAQGDRALLFLNGRLANPRFTPLVGWAQGAWRVRTAADGTEIAARDFSDSCFASLDDGRLAPGQKPPTPEEPLAALLARFQQEITR